MRTSSDEAGEQLDQQSIPAKSNASLKKCVHQLFEGQVEVSPSRIAVKHGNRTLSYAELNVSGNRLARYLWNHGVGPDQLVGVCIERSLEMVISLVGVLKAGAAYVPLDPNYPLERLKYMLEDADPQVLLTQNEVRGLLPETRAHIVEVDARLGGIHGNETENLPAKEIGVSDENLAYVIYTSGSTGEPKGMAMSHRPLVNLIEWHRSSLPDGCGKSVLQFAALGFDVSFQEIFSTLCTGGTLILLDEWVRKDNRALLELLSREGIQRLFLPPVALQSLAEAFSHGGTPPRGLEEVFAAGEQLRIGRDIREFFRNLPHCRLHNHYGPTETHVVTSLTLSGSPELWPDKPSIGLPIANTHIHILDAKRQPVGAGLEGEIYVGGVAVGKGYLRRPELTAERFIVDPFSPHAHARLYKTGDLARSKPDGTLEYLGRNDQQVKIRGFRIELGEIEACLLRHVDVKDAAVVVREDQTGNKRLVAYLVRRSPGNSNVHELCNDLGRVLPEHMVPRAFVVLDSLPVTPNGKLDRRSLPAPEWGSYRSREYEAPQGDTEQAVALIWQSILQVTGVGRHDNFFELGGDSLKIMQMLERLRERGLTTDVRGVFESQTLAQLATALSSYTPPTLKIQESGIPVGCTSITPDMIPLVALTAGQIDRIAQAVPGGAGNIKDIYPLAPMQEGILFHYAMNEHGSDPYARPMLLSIASREKVEELAAALQSIIERHDILRTAVLWEQLPQPVQVVYRHATLRIEEITLDPGRSPIEQLWERTRLGRRRLDPQRAPLMRLEVAADPQGADWYALLHTHHLICDNESLEMLIAEVVAYLEGRGQELSETLSYGRHVAETLAHGRHNGAEKFFRSKLGDVDEPTAPFGLLDVHADGSSVLRAYETLDPNLAHRLRTQAKRLSVSPATLFHAIWALVLSCTTGREDVVFGSVLLGRLQGSAGSQPILGMFINTLPLRLRLQGVSAAQLVAQTQRELVDLLSYEQASLAVAQRCSRLPRSTPLFTAILNYRHRVPRIEGQWSQTAGVGCLGMRGGTNYPIVLSVNDLCDGFQLEMETDRTIEPGRMISFVSTALRSLVEALEERPDMSALSLAVLPEAERRGLTKLPSRPATPPSAVTLLHELFERQVERTPNATAIVYEEQVLTYGELNARANQLARYLQRAGVGPDQLVGICVERSLDMVVGLVGILKAGGAYVPLDPTYPSERLAYLVKDAGPRLLLTQGNLRGKIPQFSGAVVELDRDWGAVAQESIANLEATVIGLQPHNLAYVIYTSGSTGQPKGVMVEHRNVTRLFTETDKWFSFCNQDVWTLFHSFAFDFSVWELWGGLTYGGKVVVVPQLIARSPDEFYDLLCDRGVTVLNQTPSAFAQLIDAQERKEGRHHSLRLVIFGGEALDLHTLRPWLSRNGAEGPRLVNMYGITETTVHVTYHPVTSEGIESERGSIVGGAIPDLRVYLLNARMDPVPVGVEGEIYVAGAGVARGYLNGPELTARRFVPNPFVGDVDARIYRSGDLGRWRADGTLEYLGRNDQQVKIRGFRIELAEIEARLTEHEQVKEAAVIVLEDAPGDKRLVAYLLLRRSEDGSAPDSEALREHLAQQLPEYMIPSAYVPVERFPLTLNGKLDQAALPSPDFSGHRIGRYAAPLGQVEEVLAGLWCELLRVERVGRDDDFFDLGGQSMLVLRLIAGINRSLRSKLRVADVYKSPTLRGLAARIRGRVVADQLVDLEKEVELGDEIVPSRGKGTQPVTTVLLTGSTGFLGRFLLAELLRQTDATVYCLVRDRTWEQATARLRAIMCKWDLWDESQARRVIVVPGDFAKPRLGLDPVTYKMLSEDVDSIYHCGVSMNHLETYEMAKPANVESAREILRLATCNKPKVVNYVSTLSVFSTDGSNRLRVVNECSPIAKEQHLRSRGYEASKWVADGIFETAARREIPCNVLRLGLVWADSQQGRYDELQREYRILKTSLIAGVAIENYQYEMPPTPVDYVARAVIFLGTRHSGGRHVFHISSPVQKIDGVFERCNEIAGTGLTLVRPHEWYELIRNLHANGQSLPAAPLIECNDEARGDSQSGLTQIDCSRTLRELEAAGIVAPVVDDELLGLHLRFVLARDPQLRGLGADTQGELAAAAG